MTTEYPVQNPAHEAKHGTEEEGGSSNLIKVNMDPTPGILIIKHTHLEMLSETAVIWQCLYGLKFGLFT